jgi:hypothetical protein
MDIGDMYKLSDMYIKLTRGTMGADMPFIDACGDRLRVPRSHALRHWAMPHCKLKILESHGKFLKIAARQL